ncbi:NMD protein affecting ribosome stability and mRNA decay [Methanosalsum natronophilum]|uniref:NMD protein affecting ribosome stability and mRNA decay n=1 Tax=Methanosalsum natronophilum TaxID=768733 RepID=A0A424Z3J7_9EURY|nr:MAG: NMD protein affecting ribosome stability and mRNA decay [Methanosalsum natronophilum]
MNSIVCPKCGKFVESLMGSLCKDCYIQKYDLAHLPHVIEVDICSKCGAMFDRGQWNDRKDIEEIIMEKIEKHLLIHDEAKNIEIEYGILKLSTNKYNVKVKLDATILGENLKQTIVTEVRISFRSCDVCSRISGGYYEGIIQLRATNRLPTRKEKERSLSVTSEVLGAQYNKGDRFSFITDVQELKAGLDIYIGSSKAGRNVCKSIEEDLGGHFLESPSLYGQKDGKELYRITFSMRLPEFKAGDIVHVNDKLVLIRSVGKTVNVLDLSTGTRISLKLKELDNANLVGDINNSKSTVLVAKEDDMIMVLDPFNYRTITMKKPLHLEVDSGKEIDVIKFEDELFVLP